MVGDIALLEPGEIIPCDGIFLHGHNVRCDESGATGESDTIKKHSYEDCIHLDDEGLCLIRRFLRPDEVKIQFRYLALQAHGLFRNQRQQSP